MSHALNGREKLIRAKQRRLLYEVLIQQMCSCLLNCLICMVTKTRTGALQGLQGAAGLAGADLEGVPSPLPTTSPKLHLAKLQPRLAKNAFSFTARWTGD